MEDAERITQLETQVKQLVDTVAEMQKERKEDNERYHKLDVKMVEIQYDTKLILKSVESIQKSTEETNASFTKRIESLESEGKVSIMKDVIKPLIVGSIGGGGIALLIKDYFSK